jgi:hypothetical protein
VYLKIYSRVLAFHTSWGEGSADYSFAKFEIPVVLFEEGDWKRCKICTHQAHMHTIR